MKYVEKIQQNAREYNAQRIFVEKNKQYTRKGMRLQCESPFFFKKSNEMRKKAHFLT